MQFGVAPQDYHIDSVPFPNNASFLSLMADQVMSSFPHLPIGRSLIRCLIQIYRSYLSDLLWITTGVISRISSLRILGVFDSISSKDHLRRTINSSRSFPLLLPSPLHNIINQPSLTDPHSTIHSSSSPQSHSASLPKYQPKSINQVKILKNVRFGKNVFEEGEVRDWLMKCIIIGVERCGNERLWKGTWSREIRLMLLLATWRRM